MIIKTQKIAKQLKDINIFQRLEHIKNASIQNKFQQAQTQLLKIIIRQPFTMTEKNLLISSMEKLINHVRKSQANQQEIFASLSRNDFKKILSNLQDDNLMLRKTSLNLIAELLSANSKLKLRFCQTMDITLLPGKILFHSKNIEKQVNSTNFRNLLILLKKQPNTMQSDCLLWYIQTKHPTKQLQVHQIHKDRNKVQMQVNIDPQQCIVGFCLTRQDLTHQSTTNLTNLQTNLSSKTTDVSQQSKKQQLKNLIGSNPRKVISIVGQKVNSSMTEVQPRYQRNGKTPQLQTDRPKKFMNNFLHQRKLNSSKGAQTQRINTTMSQVSVTLTTNDAASFQMSKQIGRSTMPKTTHSPYIPTLNLQNTGNINIGYRTDRIGDGYVTNGSGNRMKEMDFQKVKYQGIKITTTVNPTSRSSYGNNVMRNNADLDHPSYYNTLSNGFTPTHSHMINSLGMNQSTSINFNRRQAQNSFNFKYIKPMTTSNQEAIKFVNFFPKKPQDQAHLTEKKTIDVFQFIKNK